MPAKPRPRAATTAVVALALIVTFAVVALVDAYFRRLRAIRCRLRFVVDAPAST
jgi:hypothetical protein